MPQTQTVRLGRQGRVVLPRELREAIHASEGDALVAWVEEGGLVLATQDTIRRRLKGRYKTRTQKSAVETLIEGRREEAGREEAATGSGPV